MITQQQQDPPTENTRKRKPQTCRICKCAGHQMRTCNDPAILFQRNHIFEQIEKHAPIETILDYAHHQEFERIKIITYKTPKGKTSNISPLTSDETTYYTNLERYIQSEYEKHTNQVIEIIQRKIFYTRRLLPHNANELMNRYTSFLAEFYNNQHTIEDLDRELMQFLHLCDTLSLEPTSYTPFPSYATLIRWSNFLQYTTSRYLAQMQERNRRPAPVTQTYNYIKRRLAPDTEHQEPIDCPICMETITMPNISETNCGHQFCRTCIRNTIHKYIPTKRCPCPMCREPIHTIVRKYTETE